MKRPDAVGMYGRRIKMRLTCRAFSMHGFRLWRVKDKVILHHRRLMPTSTRLIFGDAAAQDLA